jgi:Tellurite resistance protein TehB
MKPPRWIWLCLTAALLCAQPDTDGQWKAFLTWLSAQPPDSKPANLIRPYRAELIRKGMPPAQADREMERLGHLAFTRPDGARVLWNKVYGGHDPIFVETPNALLAGAIDGHKPGKALDFGMGQGRNAVFLAMQGWDVTGFDPPTREYGLPGRMRRGPASKFAHSWPPTTSSISAPRGGT